MADPQPKARLVPESILKELTASAEMHPVFHVDDPALQALARRLAPLLAAAQTGEERVPLDYLLGAFHALFRAKQLGFVDRPGQLDDDYWKGPLTRVRYMQDGYVRTDGKWLAGLYFNVALARIAAAFVRIVALIEIQTHRKRNRNDGLRTRLQRLGLGKASGKDFIFVSGHTSAAYRVYDEANFLKHHPEGLAKGRRANMADALTGLGEIVDIIRRNVRLSGPPTGT